MTVCPACNGSKTTTIKQGKKRMLVQCYVCGGAGETGTPGAPSVAERAAAVEQPDEDALW